MNQLVCVGVCFFDLVFRGIEIILSVSATLAYIGGVMGNRVYGYIRVSSADQNEDRQVIVRKFLVSGVMIDDEYEDTIRMNSLVCSSCSVGT